MSLKWRVGQFLNRCLEPVNLRLISLTAEKRETRRLLRLVGHGQFSQPAFPVLDSFNKADPDALLKQVRLSIPRFEQFRRSGGIDGFELPNGYFNSPDAEILYGMIQLYRPRTLIEIGSGHSTLLSRLAISDGGLETNLISIDPEPRRELLSAPNEFLRKPVQESSPEDFDSLRQNDILFIDSSHEVRTGNDVIFLYLQVLPRLAPGVIIHLHDIFLPFEYPQDWVVEKRWGWNEQYLVQAILSLGDSFEVLWPGRFLQATRKDFADHFPGIGPQLAQSLWLRKKARPPGEFNQNVGGRA